VLNGYFGPLELGDSRQTRFELWRRQRPGYAALGWFLQRLGPEKNESGAEVASLTLAEISNSPPAICQTVN